MPRIYDKVAGNHPPKNRFDLSYTHFLSMKVGLLYPAMVKEMYPGDVFKIADAVHCQLQPMVAPLLSDLNLYAHTFFVPYRLIYGVDNTDGKSVWEKYITGGDDGDYDTPLPAWNPTWSVEAFTSDTIWDACGFPVACSVDDTDPDDVTYTWTPVKPKDLIVSQAPKLAYNFIWQNFYRDENLQDEIDITSNEDLLYASWKKDYFTSALESQQFGTAPRMDVDVRFTHPTGYHNLGFLADTSIAFSGQSEIIPKAGQTYIPNSQLENLGVFADVGGTFFAVDGKDGSEALSYYVSGPGISASVKNNLVNAGPSSNPISYLNSAVSGVGFDVANMRLMFAIQRLMELSMTGGHRYTEYLQAHFGVSPSDARLDRPEYVGGCIFPVNVSVSVQSAATGSGATPQGNKVGIGNINDVQNIGSYRAEEYGLIMTIISIRPKPVYQQGIPREWLRQNRFEYYSPEFANLSEQAIYRAELYVDPTDSTTPDNGIFGYQAHWNELRASNNCVSGAMREQFDYWLMSRKFSSRPALNEDFITLGHPAEYNRVWAVQDEDQFIVAWSNIIDAYRPIPAFGTPGLIDHVYGGL